MADANATRYCVLRVSADLVGTRLSSFNYRGIDRESPSPGDAASFEEQEVLLRHLPPAAGKLFGQPLDDARAVLAAVSRSRPGERWEIVRLIGPDQDGSDDEHTLGWDVGVGSSSWILWLTSPIALNAPHLDGLRARFRSMLNRHGLFGERSDAVEFLRALRIFGSENPNALESQDYLAACEVVGISTVEE